MPIESPGLTGREIILCILNNRLEDEILASMDDLNSLFVTEDVLALKFGVGTATIQAWYSVNLLKGIRVGNTVLYFKNTLDPRKN